ncbi:MAG: phosphatase PAP2 family protein [Pseudomonadota bacterium]
MVETPGRRIMALLGAIAVGFALFAVWPGLDLWVTAQFYDPAQGFSAADSGWPDLLRLAIWRVSELVLVMSVGALVFGLVRRRDVMGMPRHVWGLIVALYIAGPGLLVDLVLKPLWGRARPANVMEFGGTLDFTPPYQIAAECTRNCSFVSGEVSGAVALAVSMMLILAQVRDRMGRTVHRIAVVIVLAMPVLIAVQRIAAGRHFLSDAIFAVLFTLLVAAVLDAALGPKGWMTAWWGSR